MELKIKSNFEDRNKFVEMAKSESEVWVSCVERGGGFKLIRNIKPTLAKLSFDFKLDEYQKGSHYHSPNGIKYVKFKNLERKQNLELESQKNYGEQLHIFTTKESAIAYYNTEIDNTVIAYNRDIEYLKELVLKIEKSKVK